ncbi:uroporphyrinogen-III synthase [Flagellimonas myxillae]|uniref:uroporphyrinogen-III synthase n=1 Tax=Flagellimonas myxillae TaxID=2942214 RepID=UPI00201E8414|nr:uroporphyrinogen-III synthase [Muricauda myxillae]MCL6266795.1 uroporphyrinogen-III synthase [Muricauda myxillae]
MKTVLSTKILTPAQKELFLNSGIGIVEHNALKIEFLDFDIPEGSDHLVFTSKNAVQAFLNRSKGRNYSNYQSFCVGEKTKRLLEENGIKVVKMSLNALDLADFILKNHKSGQFLFFCGNMRRPDLPRELSKNNIRYTEIVTYNTILTPKQFKRAFDGIMFFSPSGIKSFVQENNIGNSRLFCIGNSTAEEAKNYTAEITIANQPTVENVLVQAIKYFKQYD